MFYRIGQFFRALSDRPEPGALESAKESLSPALFDLFTKLDPFEQAHALRVFIRLQERGFSYPDLLTAALLHDVGKICHPLRPWERTVSVLAKRFFPARIEQWGQTNPGGLRSGIVVAAQHARWGAELVQSAGASELIVRLIAAHQDRNPAQFTEEEKILLNALQAVDDLS